MPTSLGSVDNALRLLQVLAQRREVGVAEAGRLLGVARSTAHRLLASLVVQLGTAQLRALYRHEQLAAVTGATISTRGALEAELERVRAQG